MKIGDKVRFISEKGGGVIASFNGKNIVLVEDEDGFQIPTSISDVVVIGEECYDIKIPTAPASNHHDIASCEPEPADLPITFKPQVEERKGGDNLSLYLAFVPVDIKEISTTTFEAYIINDSNYFVSYVYSHTENAGWHLRSTGTIEPNTKLFIEEFDRSILNELAHVNIQLFGYKQDKTFILKPMVDVQLRIDGVKFYKLHSFQENDFFEQDALIYPVVENDVPARPLVIDTKKLKQEMMQKAASDSRPLKQTAPKTGNTNEPVVIDLHAHELLDTTAGMSSSEILNYQLDVFRKTIEEYKKKKNCKLIFIHGKGDGILRNAIITELRHKYRNLPYQDASFQEYGYGATQVTIK